MEESAASSSGHLVWHPVTVSVSISLLLISWTLFAVWLSHSPYDVIHKSKANALRIGLRLAMIIVPAHILAFLLPPYSTIAVLSVLVWALVWLGPEFSVFGFGIVIEWIMGWPSRNMATPRWNPLFPRRNPEGIDKAIAKGLESRSAEPRADWSALVGQEGKALSRLSPSGKVRINGTPYPARSQGAFVAHGTPVRVVETDGFGLVVNPCEPPD